MGSTSDEEIHQIVQRVLKQFLGPAPMSSASTPSPAQPGAKTDTPGPSGHSEGAVARSAAQPASRKLVAIGADHGGFELKEILKADLTAQGFEVKDVGTNSKEAVDYPDFAHAVAALVGSGQAWRGIAIDGAGIGSCIVANKVPGVRAGMAYDYTSAVNSREHNDTNVLTLGAGLIGVNLAKQIVSVWLATAFGGGRHEKRVNKIIAIEKQYLK